jgi:O-acetyl-ADP-ribose deacetylase
MATISNKIEVIKGDITKITVDAIVNAANTSLLGGGGVDGAIHRAGGVAILNECKKIVGRQGGCKTGEAVITTAGNLPAKFVIHTVGPVWNGGENYEAQKLEDCYRNSLRLAEDNGCRTIAFPGISTGVYRFPKNEAAKIAVSTVYKFISRPGKIDKVIFVCFEDEYFTHISRQMENLL